MTVIPFLLALLVMSPSPAIYGDDLSIGPDDIRIEPRTDNGYDLFIRVKPGIASVLLTESTKDPALRADNFAYRATEYNAVNGDEKRLLNGKFLEPSSNLYSLISSTPIPYPPFGRAFRILIPPLLVYGYTWSRSGTIEVGDGTFINIRSFAKAYADYSGAFQDNPYQLKVASVSPAPREPRQSAPETGVSDTDVSSKFNALIDTKGNSLDLVICLDTTASMDPYMSDIKKGLGPILRQRTARFARYRIGLVLFKDYWPDEFITRKYPFTSDIDKIMATINATSVYGGGDLPEPLYEGLLCAATEFDWNAESRQIIYLTDAAPDPIPKGKILFSDVLRESARRNIVIDSIIVPTAVVPPNPPHSEFEREMKALTQIEAAAKSRLKLLAAVEGPNPADRIADIKTKLLAPLSADSKLDLLDAIVLPPSADSKEGAAPWFSSHDLDALKAAARAGADVLVLCTTLEAPHLPTDGNTGAMSQTIARLIDVASGKELGRDIVWRVGLANGRTSLFVNGLREK